MNYIAFEEGKPPKECQGELIAREFPCDSYMYEVETQLWYRRVFTGGWQVLDEEDMPGVPKQIRAYALLLGNS